MSDQQVKFANQLAQIQQILRIYQCIKIVGDQTIAEQVKSKVNSLILLLKENSQKYELIEVALNKLIKKSFAVEVIPPLKTETKNIQSIKQSSSQKSSSFYSNLGKSNTSFSDLNSQSSLGYQAENSSQMSSENDSKHNSKTNDKLNNFCQIDSQILQATMSTVQGLRTKIRNFCLDKQKTLNQKIAYNQDLLNNIEDSQSQVFLVGVNSFGVQSKPLVYLCTLMKFNLNQVMKPPFSLQRQINDFNNLVRFPLGLIIKGKDVNAIRPEYIHFLKTMNSIMPIFFILKDLSKFQGIYAVLNPKAQQKILNQSFKNLINFESGWMKDHQHYQIGDLMKLFMVKQINCKTKMISRPSKKIELAKEAIIIEDSFECIKQQKHDKKLNQIIQFPFKTHCKFLPTMRGNFDLYYINQQNVLSRRKKFTQFESFRTEVKDIQNKQSCIFSMNLSKKDTVINKSFLKLTLQFTQGYAMIAISNLTKEIVLIKLKDKITTDMIDSADDLTVQLILKNDNLIVNYLATINKDNLKNYQAVPKVELIQMVKKKN